MKYLQALLITGAILAGLLAIKILAGFVYERFGIDGVGYFFAALGFIFIFTVVYNTIRAFEE